MTEVSGSKGESPGTLRVVAAAAGCFWLLLAALLLLLCLVAAAVSVPVFLYFGPWAVAAVALGLLLFVRAPSRRALIASTVVGLVSLALSVLLLLGSSQDFQGGMFMFVVCSAFAGIYSLLALRSLPSRAHEGSTA